jgi:hypothetical protein
MSSPSVWESRGTGGLPRFVMNLQEYPKGRGRVMFALGSENLIDWEPLGEDLTFGPDERWYEAQGRWVGISTIPDPGGGYYGYWTGSPKQRVDGLFGFGRSPDGAERDVLPPPKVKGMGRGLLREVGGAAVIDGRIYLLMCIYQGEMTVLVGDRPEGPFRIQEKNARLLFGQTHFARFAGGSSDEPLVVHHIMTATGLDTAPVSYFAPIKRAVVDDEGALHVTYWEGNDCLKTKPVDVEIPRKRRQIAW